MQIVIWKKLEPGIEMCMLQRMLGNKTAKNSSKEFMDCNSRRVARLQKNLLISSNGKWNTRRFCSHAIGFCRMYFLIYLNCAYILRFLKFIFPIRVVRIRDFFFSVISTNRRVCVFAVFLIFFSIFFYYW